MKNNICPKLLLVKSAKFINIPKIVRVTIIRISIAVKTPRDKDLYTNDIKCKFGLHASASGAYLGDSATRHIDHIYTWLCG